MILRSLGFSTDHADPAQAQCGQLIGKVLHSGYQKMLYGTSTRLDRCWRERSGATRRHQDSVNPDRLSAADQAAKILWILNSIKCKDEGRFAATESAGENLFGRDLWPASDHKCNPLVPVEPRELTNNCALHFYNWNTQRGCMKHDLLQGGPALGNNEKPDCFAARSEGLLYWMSPSDQLLIRPNECEGLRRNRSL